MRMNRIPQEADLDDPNLLMRELMMDYMADWTDMCQAAIAKGYFLAPEPNAVQ